MSSQTDLIETATRIGVENFRQTRGSVPEGFEVLRHHAPAAFAGYCVMRSDLMREGALDLKTKELIFALLDVVIGASDGAKVHAANAIRLGLTVEQLSEGLVQCIMARGITTWNMVGRATLQHAVEVAKEMQGAG